MHKFSSIVILQSKKYEQTMMKPSPELVAVAVVQQAQRLIHPTIFTRVLISKYPVLQEGGPILNTLSQVALMQCVLQKEREKGNENHGATPRKRPRRIKSIQPIISQAPSISNS